VLSPDGEWVLAHVVRFPNLQAFPSIENPDLPMTLQVTKTAADATSLSVLTGCWAAGTTTNLSKVDDTITDETLMNLNRSVITGETTAGGGGYVNVKVSPSGALETSVSGTVTANQGTPKIATAPLSSSVTCANTATALPASALTNRVSLCVYNAGANTLYLGPAGVTTGNGLPLPVGAYWCDDVGTVAYYCIVAAGTEAARILEN
jgi:hypothetical protein